jgi:hypothetical protein
MQIELEADEARYPLNSRELYEGEELSQYREILRILLWNKSTKRINHLRKLEMKRKGVEANEHKL